MYEKHWNDFFLNNTDPIPYLHPCTDTRMRRTCRPNRFYQRSWNFISLFNFIKTQARTQVHECVHSISQKKKKK